MGTALSTSSGYLDKTTAMAIEVSIGKTITRATLTETNLALTLGDGSTLHIEDNGQSCCEYRYMTTDDTLGQYDGAKFLGVEVNKVEETGDVHEIAFLDVQTSAGVMTVQTHNEHNGYYGGFSLAARVVGASV